MRWRLRLDNWPCCQFRTNSDRLEESGVPSGRGPNASRWGTQGRETAQTGDTAAAQLSDTISQR